MRKELLVIFLFLCFSCINEKIDEGYLNEDEMTELLIDLHRSESKLNFKKPGFSAKEMWPEYQKIILDRHGISDSIYVENMNYYLTHPELLESVYTRVIDSLVLEQQKLNRPN